MAGLHRSERRAHRLHVSHLTYEDNVGVLAQNILEGCGVRLSIEAYLALLDNGLLVLVEKHQLLKAGNRGEHLFVHR